MVGQRPEDAHLGMQNRGLRNPFRARNRPAITHVSPLGQDESPVHARRYVVVGESPVFLQVSRLQAQLFETDASQSSPLSIRPLPQSFSQVIPEQAMPVPHEPVFGPG
jgi:hypothetical protein